MEPCHQHCHPQYGRGLTQYAQSIVALLRAPAPLVNVHASIYSTLFLFSQRMQQHAPGYGGMLVFK